MEDEFPFTGVCRIVSDALTIDISDSSQCEECHMKEIDFPRAKKVLVQLLNSSRDVSL